MHEGTLYAVKKLQISRLLSEYCVIKLTVFSIYEQIQLSCSNIPQKINWKKSAIRFPYNGNFITLSTPHKVL